METPLISSNGRKTYEFIYDKFNNNEITEQDLVQIIILGFDLLNLKTISKFAKGNNKTFRGVSEFNKNIININGNKFVIDNE
jgi:hypothetical protein